MEVSIDKKSNTLIIKLPLQSPPKPSSTGKTLMVASTNGNKQTDLTVNGKEVHIGVNAYIYATDKGARNEDEAEG